MAYENKRRIHIARGTNTNIYNSNLVQSEGQPVFNDTKKYLSIGIIDSTKKFKETVPVRSRTIEGWYTDSETWAANSGSDTFVLSNDTGKANHYLLSGDSTHKAFLSSTGSFNIYNSSDSAVFSKHLVQFTDKRVELNKTLELWGSSIRTKNIYYLSSAQSSLGGSNDSGVLAISLTGKKITLQNASDGIFLNNNTKLTGTLDVSGTTTIAGGLSITGANTTVSTTSVEMGSSTSGPYISFTKESLTAGTLKNFDIKNSSASLTSLTVSGNTKLENTTTISKTLTVSGKITGNNDLAISGGITSATLSTSGNLSVGGNTSITGTLTTSGAATFGTTANTTSTYLTVNGATIINGSLRVKSITLVL